MLENKIHLHLKTRIFILFVAAFSKYLYKFLCGLYFYSWVPEATTDFVKVKDSGSVRIGKCLSEREVVCPSKLRVPP